MATDPGNKRCGHEGCSCAGGDRGFCSPYCESHAREHHGQHRCECGHPGCHAG
jgi:hypothetical protein